MIVDQRYVDYINSLEKELPPYLEELEQYALQTEVPIIRKEMQSFLKTLLKMNKPKQILEVGTAIGFSALLMKEFMPADGQITTIEKYEKRIPVARANFEAHGDGRITLLEGDAMEIPVHSEKIFPRLIPRQTYYFRCLHCGAFFINCQITMIIFQSFEIFLFSIKQCLQINFSPHIPLFLEII